MTRDPTGPAGPAVTPHGTDGAGDQPAVDLSDADQPPSPGHGADAREP